MRRSDVIYIFNLISFIILLYQSRSLIFFIFVVFICFKDYPFKCQTHKMVKHFPAIRRLTADKLFECI